MKGVEGTDGHSKVNGVKTVPRRGATTDPQRGIQGKGKQMADGCRPFGKYLTV